MRNSEEQGFFFFVKHHEELKSKEGLDLRFKVSDSSRFCESPEFCPVLDSLRKGALVRERAKTKGYFSSACFPGGLSFRVQNSRLGDPFVGSRRCNNKIASQVAQKMASLTPFG